MNKAFLYICTLIALFITLSGLASIRNTSELVSHILFLPVTFYLLIAAASQMTQPSKPIAAQLSTHTMTVFSILFLLFVVIIAKVVSILMMPV